MKILNIAYSIILLISYSSYSFATGNKNGGDLDKDLVVGVFTHEEKEKFDSEYRKLFLEFSGNCKKCSVQNITIYNEKGNVDLESISKSISQDLSKFDILFFDSNFRQSDALKTSQQIITDLAKSGKMIIATAGEPIGNESSIPLKKSFFGQIPQVVIVGELTERERLLPLSYYGPEMFTAIRPPKDFLGKRKAPLYFVSRLSKEWTKRNSMEWMLYFYEKKSRNRKIWLDIDDIFSK